MNRPAPGAKGREVEDAAARWLEGRGYAIEARNFRTRHGELDLIALEEGILCFVEVRWRARHDFGGPLASVDHRKQARLRRAALAYLSRRPGPEPFCRFDVLAARPGPGGVRFELVRDAFE